MKMWITIIIVAVMLLITSATIFLLPSNNENEDNKMQNELINSGDNEIINEDIIEISGDINSGDSEILIVPSGDVISKEKEISSGDVLNTNENIEKINTPANTNNENVINTIPAPIVQQEIQVVIEQTTTENITEVEVAETIVNDVVIPDGSVGMINIPKISLNTPVLDGHSLEVLKKGLGHVDETAYWQGNIGILGHNSGNAGFFQYLTKLVVGDMINYTTEHGTRIYKVSEIVQIDDTDWSYLANTKDNRITLITCVKGVPEKRLCIQATEIF